MEHIIFLNVVPLGVKNNSEDASWNSDVGTRKTEDTGLSFDCPPALVQSLMFLGKHNLDELMTSVATSVVSIVILLKA